MLGIVVLPAVEKRDRGGDREGRLFGQLDLGLAEAAADGGRRPETVEIRPPPRSVIGALRSRGRTCGEKSPWASIGMSPARSYRAPAAGTEVAAAISASASATLVILAEDSRT
jgi:hypothetical protein